MGPRVGSAFGSFLCLSALVSACGGGGSTMTSADAQTLTGSAVITWDIMSPRMEAVTCGQAGLQSASVSLGMTPVSIDCGQEQKARFDNLMPDRYPVIIELYKIDTTAYMQIRDNIVVTAGQETTKNETFTIDPLLVQKGGMNLRWKINGEDPQTACARADAATVAIHDQLGSKQSIQAMAACTTSSITISNLEAGDYGLILSLENAAGHSLVTSSIDRVTVMEGAIAKPNVVNFVIGTLESAKLHAKWTVNTATSARAACQRANADGVVIKAIPLNSNVATVSTSVACSLGEYRSNDVMPGTLPHRFFFQLYQNLFSNPPLPILLTTTSSEPFFFMRGRTTTVSVDLKTM